MKTIALLPCFFFCFVALLPAQTLAGDWYGILDMSGNQVEVGLRVAETNGAWSAHFIVPVQSTDQAIAEFRLNGDRLVFRIPEFNLNYDGRVLPGNAGIEGAYKMGTLSAPLNFTREKPEPPPGSAAWVFARFTKREVYIPMRDGKRLFTSIYVPRDTSRQYPLLMLRTPYSIEAEGEQGVNPSFIFEGRLVEDGYIFVFQDVRGRFMSEGEFVHARPYRPAKKTPADVDDNSDTYDTIDWLLANVAHHNGRVGIRGISYDGFYSTMALPAAHPALKAVSPQAPIANWFIGDDFHHNGAFFLMDAFNFFSVVDKPRPAPTRKWPAPFQWPHSDNYRFFLELGPLKNVRTRYFGDSIAFWNELMNHPNYDDFWKTRDPRPHLKNIAPAVLTVGGWFDAEDCYGALRTYEALEKQNPAGLSNRLLMGPWSHGQWLQAEARRLGNVFWGANTAERFHDLERRFFRHYLHGDQPLDLAEATVYVTGANEWREFDTWPPRGVVRRPLYLQPAGGLSFAAPTVSQSFDEYVADPAKPVPYLEDVQLFRGTNYMLDDQRFAARRPDVAVYQTDPLAEDVTLTGPLAAELFVSTTGTDADYVVKLIDVFPDTLSNYPPNEKQVPMQGYQMLVRGEVLRGRYRESFEAPRPFTPGAITAVKFALPDVAHTFRRGHRIMIQVQHSWFPLIDRNPQKFVDIYRCSERDFQKATQRMYHDVRRASRVEVWRLER
jgi:putative CocE/NonD family hydrolase